MNGFMTTKAEEEEESEGRREGREGGSAGRLEKVRARERGRK